MTQLKIKNSINDFQMSILLGLLQSWNLETEVVAEKSKTADTILKKQHSALSQARGMWADYDIDVKRNRAQTHARRTKTVSAS
jgi:hypothetical protein